MLNFLGRQQRKAARRIAMSNHYPIVVVGHSLGAHTAYKIAGKTAVNLLVTLDGVSIWGDREHLPHPGRNVRWIDVDARGDSWGPDWDGQENANRWVKNYDSGHYDVVRMFEFAKDEVLQSLRSCVRDDDQHPTVVERAICEVPSVACNVTWELTNSCPEVPVIKVRFFEFDESNSRIASWKESKIRANGSSKFNLDCESPGHWVCYGAANQPGYYWGVGLDGKEVCDDCCAACRTGAIFHAGSLSCR